MTGKHGEVSQNELWIRCPFCGDSQHDSTKAHCSINLKTGAYHCYRCKAGGFLSPKRRMSFLMYSEASELEAKYLDFPDLIPGPGCERKSLLLRFHYRDGATLWDAFEMRDPRNNRLTGIHLRRPGESRSTGSLGMAWAGPLLSSPSFPLRLVEGPYDVRYSNDVCCFGLPSKRNLEMLRGHFIILCPDGDIWLNSDLRDRIFNTIKTSSRCNILGIEYLRDGLDPDELPADERKFIPLSVLRNSWRKPKWESFLKNEKPSSW